MSSVKMMCKHTFLYLATFLFLYKIHPSKCAPKDVDDKLCPGTPTYHIRDNTRIFSSLVGQRCSIENNAYVFGAMISQYSSIGKSFEQDNLLERWENIAYLDASSYDSSKVTPPPSVAPTCIFNQRLAKQQSSSGDYKAALSCNPFELTYCRTEYDESLTIKSSCDCNYLYSVKKEITPGIFKCLAKAGVPCNFTQDPSITDPFLKLPASLACDGSLVCRSRSKEKQNEIFKMAFHGIGINPIAYEYMIKNANGYCDCNAKDNINAMNECVASGAAWYSGNHIIVIMFFIMILS